LFPVLKNWSRFHALQIEFTIDDGSLPMTFSVRDGRRVEPPRRRFDVNQIYALGRHVVAIDLDQISRGSTDVAPVDVSAVQSFHIILDAKHTRRVVRLHRIWLE
jgi:hypothetical protein